MRKYEIIAEDTGSITYRENAICNYWLYGSAILFLLGAVPGMFFLNYMAAVGIGLYFLIIYFPAVKDSMHIRSAVRAGTVQISGSRWSFSNPHTIVVSKNDA